jgi:hypothetical protein
MRSSLPLLQGAGAHCDRELVVPNDLTFCEEVAKTRWGRYLTREQAQVLDRGCRIVGEPGLALEVGQRVAAGPLFFRALGGI